MGAFPISFTNKYRKPNKQEKPKVPKRLRRSYKDTEFQKGLAVCSYFVMVFVAVCTFSPATVAGAAEIIQAVVA
ncbi:MAG: hypothetical protein ACR2O3_01535 [Rhizobiaceae bacterium]